MITKPTTIILGAGASMPYGLPSGIELKKKILSGLVKYNYNVSPALINDSFQGIEDLGYSEIFIEKFRDDFAYSGRTSIDSFLEHRKEYIDIGKILISREILNSESFASLFSSSEDDWYEYLWNRLNTKIDKFETNTLSVLTFNYDRSFEFYFLNVIRRSFGLTIKDSFSLLQKIPIIHLHGKIGDLSGDDIENTIDYGERINEQKILQQVSKNIKIIHDELMPSEEYNTAYEILENSERIYILGFSYNPINIERLKLDQFAIAKKVICGTTLGLTNHELYQNVGRELYFKLGKESKQVKCLQFLRDVSLD